MTHLEKFKVILRICIYIISLPIRIGILVAITLIFGPVLLFIMLTHWVHSEKYRLEEDLDMCSDLIKLIFKERMND